MTTVIQFPERTPDLTLDQRISQEVRALMGRYNVSQMRLAEWLGLNQTAVSARLNGRTDWKARDIERVAEGFAVHPAQLMGGYAAEPGPGGPGTTLPILTTDTHQYPQVTLLRTAA
jgi:hypothetical protein